MFLFCFCLFCCCLYVAVVLFVCCFLFFFFVVEIFRLHCAVVCGVVYFITVLYFVNLLSGFFIINTDSGEKSKGVLVFQFVFKLQLTLQTLP